MANVFRMQCDEDRDIDRCYHSLCPLWCEDDPDTEDFCLDFAAQSTTANEDDPILDGYQIPDDSGNLWTFESSVPGNDIGFFSNLDPCGRAMTIDGNQSQLTRDIGTPVINFSRPWSMCFCGTVIDGNFVASVDTGGTECGGDLSMTVAQDGSVPLWTQTQFGMGDLCSLGAGPQRFTPPMIYESNTLCCMCVGISVDPCNHRLALTKRIVADTSPLNDCETFWEGGNDGGLTELEFELDCNNWWLPQGGYDAVNPATRWWPSSLIQPYGASQQFRIVFGDGGDPLIDLKKFCVSGQYFGVDDLKTMCD